MSDALHKLDLAHRNAEAARQLVENPMLRACLDAIRDEALREIEDSAPDEREERDAGYHLIRALKRLDAKISAAACDAEITTRNMRSELRRLDR